MAEQNWAWLVSTSKGCVYIEVNGEWNQEEAEQKTRKACEILGVEIQEMTPRKRPGKDIAGYISPSKTNPWGFELYAGADFHAVFGKQEQYYQSMAKEGYQQKGGR